MTRVKRLYSPGEEKKDEEFGETALYSQMSEYKKWLTKNRDLFGFSSREVRKIPLACIVVLWQPTYLADHEASFYSKAGEDKILTINKKGKVFLVERKEVIKVMKAYLASEIEYQQ